MIESKGKRARKALISAVLVVVRWFFLIDVFCKKKQKSEGTSEREHYLRARRSYISIEIY